MDLRGKIEEVYQSVRTRREYPVTSNSVFEGVVTPEMSIRSRTFKKGELEVRWDKLEDKHLKEVFGTYTVTVKGILYIYVNSTQPEYLLMKEVVDSLESQSDDYIRQGKWKTPDKVAEEYLNNM